MAQEKESGSSPLWLPIQVLALTAVAYRAYSIRLHAIREYGKVIHEFDPWFNYRATEYLAEHGSEKFFKWYDYKVWYPLGRPVGTTIYPGMQFASVWIWRGLNAVGIDMSLNDVCCYVPAWFGVSATLFLGLLAREASGSNLAAILAAAVMAIVPAHLMRSVGGGYDNESVAITCMCATFFLWVRSLKTPSSWWVGILAGLAYFCMVATWGGYVFVINMIGLHAGVTTIMMVAKGKYQSYLHRAYSLFYVIGTALAIQVPVVGMTPLKSLEQLGAFGVFALLQLLEVCEIQRRRKDLDPDELHALRKKVFGAAALAAVAVVAVLSPMGYFGPLSSRVRSLFVPHTRTGNPLVDSVSEHQPARPEAYFQMLHDCCIFAPAGFILCFVKSNHAKTFVALYAMVAYHFSTKMHRLLLLMGPVGSVLTGIAVAEGMKWSFRQAEEYFSTDSAKAKEEEKEKAAGKKEKEKASGKKEKAAKRAAKAEAGVAGALQKNFQPVIDIWNGSPTGRLGIALALCLVFVSCAFNFSSYCDRMSVSLSHPSIMFKAQDSTGRIITVDDYREAYWWLRDNTPEDSRVMSWWDYGYQINGVAQRTTIADGNTWNHEHIATLGRCLASPVKEAHDTVRHLADYVLVWAGDGGDLAKSPHMARIGNSVFNDICPGDPTCSQFGFTASDDLLAQGRHTEGEPTPMMRASLLYNLHNHNMRPGVKVDSKYFREAFTSKYGKVRIFEVMDVSQESKDWIADPANRVCDAPGSWYCTGQYPPAITELIKRRKAFRQLEDFNQGGDEESENYHRQYMQRMTRQSAYEGS
eukprot:TRINITY_DN1335_c0_g1_i1.p1 TRINITY_DN1335_c0_g1~~TRINITY_DN1335_c0_g1_i1.p1  ORF type:complete len:809 (+),score=257.85 TRINITY_DN1335_c0_g1_i1:107-2533(+)